MIEPNSEENKEEFLNRQDELFLEIMCSIGCL